MAAIEGRVWAKLQDYVPGSGLVVGLLSAESADQRVRMIQYQELRCRGWNLGDVALENAGAQSIHMHPGVLNVANGQQKKLIHQSTPMAFFDGPEIVGASYPIQLGFVLEDMQRFLALKRHSVSDLGEIESGLG